MPAQQYKAIVLQLKLNIFKLKKKRILIEVEYLQKSSWDLGLL